MSSRFFYSTDGKSFGKSGKGNSIDECRFIFEDEFLRKILLNDVGIFLFSIVERSSLENVLNSLAMKRIIMQIFT